LRIAIIFTRLGPYHIARLSALAAAASRCGGQVVGIEVARADGIYDWAPVDGGDAIALRTLFPERHYATLSGGEIRNAVCRMLDLLDPDAVAINGWSVAEARAAILWAERRGRVAVVMSETKADDAPRIWWKEIAKRWLLSRCDAALVGGRSHARYLEELGLPADRIVLGYDVVDNDHFRRGSALVRQEATSRRSAAGLPDNYFFACTRFIARKNVDLLLRAYARFRVQALSGVPWGLVIAGGGEEDSKLRALERSLGLDGVIWPGFVQYDELPLYYGLASAFVHAASSEPWGLVVNEAIASSLPVLVSRPVGAAGELVAHGVNGYLFNPLDVDDLSEAMTRLAAMSADHRADMARASAAIAERWEPSRFAAGLLEAIDMGKQTNSRRNGNLQYLLPASRARPAMARPSGGSQ
jgi:glycosyltransferase involved in cell wall biosynthesis